MGTTFSPHDQVLFSAGSKILASWDAVTGKQLQTVQLDQECRHLYLSPHGGRAIVDGSPRIISPVVCDVPTTRFNPPSAI